MSVHKRTYRAYAGDLTPAWSRFLVLYRYSRQSLFRSRNQTALFVLCFIYPLICLLAIYLAHNLAFLEKYNLRSLRALDIDGKFFLIFVSVQTSIGFLLTAFTGPGLISPDLSNGALPLYFCRPFSRSEYILGKAACLVILLSWISWIPGLLLFAVQSGLAGFGWFRDNLWLAGSILLSSWIWIAVFCLLALALSAWVRWRIVATALLLAVMFLGAGFGQAINGILRTDYGYLIDLTNLLKTVDCHLFGVNNALPISQAEAWFALLTTCGLCLLLLWRRVRAYEVVK